MRGIGHPLQSKGAVTALRAALSAQSAKALKLSGFLGLSVLGLSPVA